MLSKLNTIWDRFHVAAYAKGEKNQSYVYQLINTSLSSIWVTEFGTPIITSWTYKIKNFMEEKENSAYII